MAMNLRAYLRLFARNELVQGERIKIILPVFFVQAL
jgi:hypothetical protein